MSRVAILLWLALAGVAAAVPLCPGAAGYAALRLGPSERLTPQQRKLKTGLAFVQKAIDLSGSSPEQLKQAASSLEKLAKENPVAFDKWVALAEKQLRSNLDGPGVRANLEHVYSQHLAALSRDAKELAETFGIEPKVMYLLMVMHDLGKVKAPNQLKTVLNEITPDLFKDSPLPASQAFLFNLKGILAHEYGSMYWVETLGKTSGVSPEHVEAVQRLIANHNFGLDLTDPKNKDVTGHFWPFGFRTLMIPAFQKLGLDVSAFPRDAEGNRQYGRSKNIYSDLLSLYDRVAPQPVSPAHPQLGQVLPGGLANLKKFQVETFLFGAAPAIRKAQNEGKKPANPFNGKALLDKMTSDIADIKKQYEIAWSQAFSHLPSGTAAPEKFGPKERQAKAFRELDLMLAALRKQNSDRPLTRDGGGKEGDVGYAYYQKPGGPLYRVVFQPGKNAFVEQSTDNGVSWKAHEDAKSYTDPNPYSLYFKLIQEDIRWKDVEEWSPFRS